MRISDSDHEKRWMILDKLLGGDSPVSTEQIYKEWHRNKIRGKAYANKDDLKDLYKLNLRQDLLIFETCYKKAHPEGELLRKEKIDSDPRKKTYIYSERGFSIIPFLKERYTQSDWKALDRILDRLEKELPETMAQKVRFSVRSHLDALRGSACPVEWPGRQSGPGYDMLPVLFDYIIHKKVIELKFGLHGEKKRLIILHPYLLKEYDGTWYCLGYCEGYHRGDEKNHDRLWPIALDRVTPGSIRVIQKEYREYQESDGGLTEGRISYFDNIIGVTKEYDDETRRTYHVSEKEQDIIIEVHDKATWDYLMTNPLHNSQEVVTEPSDYNGQHGEVRLKIKTNIEMYSALLAWGPGISVKSPDFVRERMRTMTYEMSRRYKED